MRGVLRAGVLAAGLAGLGCHHDKYGMKPAVVEEYPLPPDEPRYNLPEKAPYRKPAPKDKDDKKAGPPGGFNKMGPGGF